MKLVLVFIILALHTSWQYDSTETINETLDKLIQQTDQVEHQENNTDFYVQKNNSRIFFLNPPERDQKTEQDKSQVKVTSIKPDAEDLLSVADILHALGLEGSKSADGADYDVGKNNIINEITFTVEKNTKPITTNTDHGEVKLLIERLMSKSGRPADIEDIPDDTLLTFSSGIENNLLRKYPEIIIDRITYHSDENKNKIETKTKALIEERDSQAAKDQNSYSLALAEELKSLLEEVQKMKVTENVNENELPNTDHTRKKQNIQENQIATQQPCRNVLMPYSSTCKSMLLKKLPEYENLHDTITRRAGNPYLNTNLQLNKWGAYNARQKALMRITRAQKLKRIHFVTDLITNMMSRFVYRPLFS